MLISLAAAPLFGTKAARPPSREPNQGSPEQKTAYLTMLSSLAPPAMKHSLPFPAPLPTGTFARWGRGTSGTGVSLASLQKSLFVSGVFTFPHFQDQMEAGRNWVHLRGHKISKRLTLATVSARHYPVPGPGQPWHLPLPPSASQLVTPLSLYFHHYFFLSMGANARECSQLLQHALSSPLSSCTKMGGLARTGEVFTCPVLPHSFSPPCWSTGAVGGMAGEASQIVSSAPSLTDLVWPHRSQTP